VGVACAELHGKSLGYQAVDNLANLLRFLHYLLVGKAHHLVAVLGQSGVALCVSCAVCFFRVVAVAVDLDNQSGASQFKVNDVVEHGPLPVDLDAFELFQLP